MRSLSFMELLIVSLSFSSEALAAKQEMTVQIGVYWEGRELKEPNVEALDRFRKGFPDIPLTHFVNPVYFLDEAKKSDNAAALQKIFSVNDEVALYLAPIEALVKKSGLILKLSPSFWSYTDESEVCENDCGLDVPLTVYNREETHKLFIAAHQSLRKAGFNDLKSLAVRGWLEVPFLLPLAAAFGYRYDLSPIDPRLVSPKLREFPINSWVAELWSQLADAEPDAIQKFSQSQALIRRIPQRGGILELNEHREILARFDRLLRERQEHPKLETIFTLGISVETAYQSWPKLRMILQSLDERAKKQGFSLRYSTASMAKNSRPTASNMRISTRSSQPAELRK